jgi:short-subunit dehydrogenase
VPTAVVTGGSSGIGLALARLLRDRGWTLVLAARGEQRLQAAARELGAAAVVCDVARDEDALQLAAAAQEAGGCSLLVQCAGRGSGGRGELLEADVELYRELLETNALGLVRVARAHWQQLAASRGRIANVVSVAGTIALPGSSAYSASKHAALGYSRALAIGARRHGIAVTTVNPGPIVTPGFPQRELLERRLGRLFLTSPEHCAERILAAVERGTPELFVPAYLRLPAALQAAAPGLLARARVMGLPGLGRS